MVTFLSWIVVLSIALYFAGIIAVPFINEALIPLLFILPLGIGGISVILLIILLIRERYKDKKEEDKDDLSKY